MTARRYESSRQLAAWAASQLLWDRPVRQRSSFAATRRGRPAIYARRAVACARRIRRGVASGAYGRVTERAPRRPRAQRGHELGLRDRVETLASRSWRRRTRSARRRADCVPVARSAGASHAARRPRRAARSISPRPVSSWIQPLTVGCATPRSAATSTATAARPRQEVEDPQHPRAQVQVGERVGLDVPERRLGLREELRQAPSVVRLDISLRASKGSAWRWFGSRRSSASSTSAVEAPATPMLPCPN